MRELPVPISPERDRQRRETDTYKHGQTDKEHKLLITKQSAPGSSSICPNSSQATSTFQPRQILLPDSPRQDSWSTEISNPQKQEGGHYLSGRDGL